MASEQLFYCQRCHNIDCEMWRCSVCTLFFPKCKSYCDPDGDLIYGCSSDEHFTTHRFVSAILCENCTIQCYVCDEDICRHCPEFCHVCYNHICHKCGSLENECVACEDNGAEWQNSKKINVYDARCTMHDAR